ncbi:MAG: DUF1611 domain-containing protein [Cyanobacteria bacterium]|nr:DUF1611 domain-containing protein [Cyanobacteriota bacterium]
MTPLIPENTPLVILSEGCFGEHSSKTATGVIRYGHWPIVAVLDSTQAGKTVRTITGIPCNAPIVSQLSEAFQLEPKPKALLIGTAPQGGGLPLAWRSILMEAIRNGLHLISGLHDFLKDDPELLALANTHHVMIWDVRDPEQCLRTQQGQLVPMNLVAKHPPREIPFEKTTAPKVITMVGTDCCVGKMFTALELTHYFEKQGKNTGFIATGQTGIMITGSGVPLDRMIGDFMAGHVERWVLEAIDTGKEWIFVEGQGSLLHPGYSGVTLSLLHGSNPDGMILCHHPSLKTIWGYSIPIPPLSQVVQHYEQAAAWAKDPALDKPAQVLGIALNTSDFSEEEAMALIEATEKETGLPTTDPVRLGMAPLYESLLQHFS